MNSEVTRVKIAGLNVIKNEGKLLTTLGSCVGICLYDQKNKIAGMSHIMLPEMLGEDKNPNKYADKAIPNLINMMKKSGANKKNIVAKISGGAVMFNLPQLKYLSKIGENNIIAVKKILKELGIRIISEDTGGSFGRNVYFDAQNGEIEIHQVGNKNKSI